MYHRLSLLSVRSLIIVAPVLSNSPALHRPRSYPHMLRFIYGAVLFSNVGAWSDDSNNCTQNAPTLFGIMYWYDAP